MAIVLSTCVSICADIFLAYAGIAMFMESLNITKRQGEIPRHIQYCICLIIVIVHTCISQEGQSIVKGFCALAGLLVFFSQLVRFFPSTIADATMESNKLKAKIKDLEQQIQSLKNESSISTTLKCEREYLDVLSHELRTPLFTILAMSTMAVESALFDRSTKDNEVCELYDSLATIKKSSDFLLGMINSVLDCSKYQSKGFVLSKEPFSLLQACEDAMELVTIQGDRYGRMPPELCLFMDPNLPEKAVGDSVRFRQILINLLSNAVKFTPESGSVSLTVSRISSPYSGKFGIQVAVADTGLGIKYEDRTRLFDKFVQVDNAATRNAIGTGLGLSIVRRLVELMDGSVWIESNFPQGTKFVFQAHLEHSTQTPPSLLENTDVLPNLLIIQKPSLLRDSIVQAIKSQAKKIQIEENILSLQDTVLTSFAGVIIDQDSLDETEIICFNNLISKAPQCQILKLSASKTSCKNQTQKTQSRVPSISSSPSLLKICSPSHRKPVKISLIRAFCEQVRYPSVVKSSAQRKISTISESTLVETVTTQVEKISTVQTTVSKVVHVIPKTVTTSAPKRSITESHIAPAAEPTFHHASRRLRTYSSSFKDEISRGDFKGLKVLIVEDNQIMQCLLRKMLDKLGLTIDIANDGVEALDKVHDTEYDVIFMDFMMPRMDGIQCTTEIRRLIGSDSIQPWIVSLSASGSTSNLMQFKQAGANDTLGKPVQLSEIRKCLSSFLEHKAMQCKN